MENKSKCRVKNGVKSIEEYINGRRINFSGYTGFCNCRDLMCSHDNATVYVEFDDESKIRLPKVYIQQGKSQGFDPFSYSFHKSEIELIL